MDTKNGEEVFQGIAASPGISYGQTFLIKQIEIEVPSYQVDLSRKDEEIQRFEQALLTTRQQITKIQQEISVNLSEDEARIFDAHLLVLEDQVLIEESIREMEKIGLNIEAAFYEVGQRYITAFDQIDDEYLRERASDIRDVVRRVIHNFSGRNQENITHLLEKRILISHDISPSDSATIDHSKILGIVTDVGSKTSHAVIVARSMKIPAVVGLRNATSRLQSGDWVIVDGYEGVVIARPSEETLARYGQLELEHKSFEKKLLSGARLPAKTQDGKKIKLLANIESADEAISAQETGVDGVGLFRTEFLFLGESGFPDEEEQFLAYKKVAEIFKSQPVIIRTLDLGGDKSAENLTYFPEQESNPFLGFRAIRFCLKHTEVFKSQLRAVLRASAFGNIKVMYPMISGTEELIRANALLDEAKEELRTKGEDFDEEISVGSMIEIPSAAVIGDLLAKECDFFSIGTNDLIQYLIAIDRLNDRIAHLYEPTHLGVLRTIKSIIDTGHANKIEVGVCGEMAGDPVLVPLLIGLGADELSVSPSGIPAVKYLIQNMKFSEAVQLAESALACSDAKEIYAQAKDFYETHMGDVSA